MRPFFFASCILLALPCLALGNASIDIDLTEQRAYLLIDGRPVTSGPISSGREGYGTRPGKFKVTEKDQDHRSNLYGSIVDRSGNVLDNNATPKTRRPAGTIFRGASMPYFMRFDGGIGLHAGYLPGRPDSHGCVRMPDEVAETFYRNIRVGTPVVVYGDPKQKADTQRIPSEKIRRATSVRNFRR